MMWLCNKCNQLVRTLVGHVCPTPQYLEARDTLIAAAAQAEEEIDIDELELAAWRKGGS